MEFVFGGIALGACTAAVLTYVPGKPVTVIDTCKVMLTQDTAVGKRQDEPDTILSAKTAAASSPPSTQLSSTQRDLQAAIFGSNDDQVIQKLLSKAQRRAEKQVI
jgi:hypothetical protein